MSTLTRTRLRLSGDAANFDAPLDVLRRATPQFWRGNDVQFEIAVFFNGALQDVSNLASLTLEIRPLGTGGAAPDPGFTPLMGATITSFDSTTTLDNWNTGTKQHAVVTFTAAQSNIVAGPAWLSIFVITNDSPGRVITLCAGPVRVLEDGSGLATTPAPAGDTFYTAVQCDARFALIGSGGGGGAAAWGSITGTLASQADLSTVLSAKAPLASPALTGTPTAPTISPASDSSTKVATTAFVQAAIAAAGGGGGGGGSGSVTSVALSVPSFLSVAGSPITTNGTLAVTLANQSANQIFAGPGSGSAATPSFRALVAADVPAIAQSGVTGLTSALAALAPLASPALTGAPSAPTPGSSDNSTKLATTAWVRGYTAPITNDGSGHYVFGGSTPYQISLDTETTYIAGLTVYNGLAAISQYGDSVMVNSRSFSSAIETEGGRGNVLSIQATDARANSAIRFLDDFNNEVCAFGHGNSDEGYLQNMNFWDLTCALPNGNEHGSAITPTNIIPGGIHRSSAVSNDGTWHNGWMIYSDTAWNIIFGGGDSIGNPLNPEFVLSGPLQAYTTATLYSYDTSSNGYSQYEAKNNNSHSTAIASYGSSFSFAAFPTDGGAVFNDGPGGLSLMTLNTSAPLDFFTGGYNSSNHRLRIDSLGNLLFSNAVTSAPSVTLASGQYQLTVYDNGSSPVLRVRYNTGSTVKVGDLTLS
jgi:hypothetical protein